MTALASLKKGEVDALREVDMQMASEVKTSGEFQLVVAPGGPRMMIWFDNHSPESVWSDLRAREALEYAVDKEEIASNLGLGFSEPVYEVVAAINEVGNPSTTPRKYDPDKAKQLLAEAGLPRGVKVTINTEQKFSTDFLVALQEDLAFVGIDIEIQPMPSPAWREMRFSDVRGNDLRYDRQGGGAANVLGATNGLLSSKSIHYPGMKRPDGWEDLLDQAMVLEAPAKRIALLEEMNRLGYTKVMFVPLWTVPEVVIITPKLKSDLESLFYTGGLPNARLEYAWLEK